MTWGDVLLALAMTLLVLAVSLAIALVTGDATIGSLP